jgi:hypothetical protein
MSPSEKLRRVVPGLLLSCTCAAGADGPQAPSPAPIRWDLALINGLQVTSESLGIRDRIRVVTLGTSGCTPRSAKLLMVNPKSGARTVANMPVQGRSIEFEIEDTARPDALLRIECQARGTDAGPSRTFTLALDPEKAR